MLQLVPMNDPIRVAPLPAPTKKPDDDMAPGSMFLTGPASARYSPDFQNGSM